ncbi:branched-chain amino acid aminotransferase [Streptomyces reniochalinae]|uniref:Branched-chain-amino-acid aminotransferase n=1 Tax=Streptomyces reniochalinae TaxID=2250578 RepID=A0A367EHI3_9ACTN|nr:branched-chain amino acid aminotransferase [Streptomyces reniochalinae]RCG17524.1 branched-chain amino acid aminotransferase [Streptomyces reniochalinae]
MSAPVVFAKQTAPDRLPSHRRAALLRDPAFGTVFTEHMSTVRYREGKGWHDARVEPFGPLPLSPASSVLHYGQEVFEGLKVYRTDGGRAQLFRPDANARRLRRSARRLSMPEVPDGVFLGAVEALFAADRDWLPQEPGSTLYLRPFLIATEVCIGARPAEEYLFCVIATPPGTHFAAGTPAMTVWICDGYTRAAPGGTGAAKCGGNYAAAMAGQAEAAEAGCDQVVFLDAAERAWVEELGGMNIFFVFDDGTLLTPPLTGSVLPGITRDSVLSLARARGYRVAEEPYRRDQWRADAAAGRVREVFACGTAAVVTGIGTVRSPAGEFTVPGPAPGPVTVELRTAVEDIQFGRVEPPENWTHPLR